jgi:hypothetical protein
VAQDRVQWRASVLAVLNLRVLLLLSIIPRGIDAQNVANEGHNFNKDTNLKRWGVTQGAVQRCVLTLPMRPLVP